MILVIITALTAVCGAAKLDKTYLPPISAKTAGGSPGALLAPLDGSNQGLRLPTGSYTNDAHGVVVDAANPGTRTSGPEPTGLGGPRDSYGSKDSKVGDAAFSSSTKNSGGFSTRIAPGFDSFVGTGDNADKSRGTLKFSTDVGLNNYSYGFETDNGISVGENGVAENGVQAEGGYSYKGDDGKTYQVTYTADEGGYKPQGQHLPTPPPIPEEIIKSLEKNAKEEAAGHVDDGSYDAQKYNDGGDYSSNVAANNNGRPTIGGGDATTSGSFVNQGNQGYRPSSGFLIGAYNPATAGSESSQAEGAQGYGHTSGDKQPGFVLSNDQSGSQGFSVSGNAAAIGGQFGQAGSTTPQASNNFGTHGKFGANSHFGSQSTFNSQSTENRFGVQASKPEGSVFGSPVRTPNFNSLPGSSNENSAFSSAISSGFGSASAFASTGPSSYELKNENIPLSNNFGSAGQFNDGLKSGSDSSAPSSAVASASVSGTPTFGQHSGSQQSPIQGPTAIPQFPSTSVPSNTKFESPSYVSGQSNGLGFNSEYLPPVNAFGSTEKVSYNSNIQGVNSQNQLPNLPSSAIATAIASGNEPQIDQGNQQFNGFKAESNQNNFPSRLGENQPSGISATNSGNFLKPQGFESSSTASNANSQSSSSTSGKPSSGSSAFGISSQQSSPIQSFNSKPSQYSPVNNVISQPTGLPQFGNTNTQFSSVQPTQPTLGFGSISTQGPTKVPDTELTTPFESNEPGLVQTSNQASNSFVSGNIPVSSPTTATSFVSTQQGSQSGSVFGSQSKFPAQGGSSQSTLSHKPTLSQGSFSQTGPTDATFASSTQQPALSQQQGNDNSYFYKQPSKPFVTPPLSPSSQFSNNYQQNVAVSSSQQASNYPNAQTSSTTGLSQSSSSYNNGVTQAAISPFPSPSSSAQFPSQFNQFGTKPTQSSQFSQSAQSVQQASSQFGTTGSQQILSQKPISQFEQKPIHSETQFGQSSVGQNSDSSLSQTQQYQGTIYQYNKPAETLPAPAKTDSQAKPSQTTDSRFGSQQGSSHFSGQSISNVPSSTFQQTQTAQVSEIGSQSSNLFGQKPTSQGQYTQTSQFGQKPVTSLQTNYQQSQFGGSSTQNLKPQTAFGSTFSSTKQGQQSVFAKKPIPSTQSGSYYQQPTPSSSFVTQKPFGSSQNTGSYVVGQTTQGSSSTSNSFSQGPTSQFGQKPIDSTFQKPQFGSTSQGNGFASSTGQTSFGQKPFGSTGSQFVQKPQSLGSSFTSNTGSKGQSAQSSQFGASQTSQSLQGSGFSSTTGPKPLDSSYQQSQFESTSSQFNQFSSQFGQKPQSLTHGSSFTSNTGSKGQSAQTSQFGVSGTSQSGQTTFGQKPIGSSFQQSQFESTSSQLGQNSQAQGSGSHSSASQSTFGQKPSTTKPIGSNNQQFGSSNSQFGFGQKPQSTQGSYFTSNTASKGQSSFGQKPIGSYQQSQFGTTGSKFGEKPQVTQGSSFPSNTFSQTQNTQFGKKPATTTQSGSAFQYPQFGQNSQAQGSLLSSAGHSSFGQKPSTTKPSSSTNQQFGSNNSQFAFGQKPQTAQGSYFTSNAGSKGQSAQSSQFGVTGSSQNTGSGSTVGSGSSYQQTQFSSFSGSKFEQKPQTAQGSYFTSNTGSKGQSTQSSQLGVSGSSQNTGSGSTLGAGSGYQQTQFSSFSGSKFDQKPQTTQGSYFTTNTGSKGQSAQSSQTQFSGSSGSKFGQKPQTTGTVSQTSSQFGVNPFGSSQSTQVQQTQFGSTSQSSQVNVPTSTTNSQSAFTQVGQKPFGISQTSGSSSQKNQFGSSSSVFDQKPLTTQVQKPSSTFGSYNQFSQFGSQTKKPVSSTQAPFISQFGSTTGQFGQQPQAQANAFASSSGSDASKFGNTQSNQVSKYQQTSQFGVQGQKPVQSSLSQTNQQSQYTQTSGSQTNIGSGQFGGQQQTSQFGVQGQKPVQSSLSQTNYQQFQYTQTSGSQGNIGSGQFGGQPSFGVQAQKPIGSQFNNFQTQFNQGQKPFGSSQTFQIGQSAADQKTQPTQSSITTANVASQSSGSSFGTQSADGYDYNKPQNAFNFASQSGQDQKLQSTGVEPVKPFGSSSAQAQSTEGSTQFGVQPIKADSSVSSSQPSLTQFSGQPFQPASTVSTQSSSFQSETSSTSNSQFGVQPTKPTLSYFSGQPFKPASTQDSLSFGSQSFGLQSQNVAATTQKPSQSQFSIGPFKTEFSSTPSPSVPSRLGSNLSAKPEGLVVSTLQTPIIPVPGYEIHTSNQGTEEFGGPRDPPRFDDKSGYYY